MCKNYMKQYKQCKINEEAKSSIKVFVIAFLIRIVPIKRLYREGNLKNRTLYRCESRILNKGCPNGWTESCKNYIIIIYVAPWSPCSSLISFCYMKVNSDFLSHNYSTRYICQLSVSSILKCLCAKCLFLWN